MTTTTKTTHRRRRRRSKDFQASRKDEEATAKDAGVDHWPSGENHEHLTICVFGASGDLAKKKIYPSLLALFYEGRLPKSFSVFGYARSKMSSEEFREKIRMSLGCRIEANADCDDFMEVFLSRCEYVHGNYDVDADFQKLDAEMLKTEEGKRAMRVFYLSIPPSIFVPVAQMSSRNVQSKTGETRVIVEKPFGRDLESSRALTKALAAELSEKQTYRICLLYTSPSPRDKRQSRMPSSA